MIGRDATRGPECCVVKSADRSAGQRGCGDQQLGRNSAGKFISPDVIASVIGPGFTRLMLSILSQNVVVRKHSRGWKRSRIDTCRANSKFIVLAGLIDES